MLNGVGRLRPPPRLGAAAALVGLIWLAVVGGQMLRGWPGWTERFPVKAAQIQKEPKANGVWRAPIPKAYRSWLTNKRGVLLLDGKPAGRRSSSFSAVLRDAGGIFVFYGGYVKWRSADGSDPRESGSAYELELPKQLRPWTLWAGLSLLIWGWSARRTGGPGPAPLAAPGLPAPRWTGPQQDVLIAVILMLVSTVTALSWIRGLDSNNDGAMMLKGLPYSDAACWHEMAVGLAEGRGLAGPFDGQRPWYSVMMAMVHVFRGLVVENGLILNALALGLASGMVFVIGRLMHSRMAGIGAAVVLLLSQQHRRCAEALMTETTGLGLTVLSIALILTAVSLTPPGQPRRGWAAGLALGGLFQGLGNLTCPYTLPAFPFYGILLLWEGRRVVGSWKSWRVLQPGLIFAAGFLLVMGPWLVRQHQVHGLATLSTQTADLLYGGTFEEGPMKPEQVKELREHFSKVPFSVEEKYRFGMKRYVETVTKDPLDYLRRLGAGALGFFGYFNVSSPEPAMAALFVVLAGIWRQRRQPGRLAWIVAGAVVLAEVVWMIRLPGKVSGPWPLLALAVTSAVLAWVAGPPAGRVAVSWITATLAGCMVINALTGNLIANRCWIFCDWCLWLLVLAAVDGLHQRLGRVLAVLFRQPVRPVDEPQDFAGVRRFTVWTTALVLAVQAVGGVLLMHRQRNPVVFALQPPEDDAARVRAWAEARFAAKAAESGHPLQFQWVRLGEGACYLAANEAATSFSRAFASQPWPRTLRLVRGVAKPGTSAPGWMVRLPGDARLLPEDRPGLLISWLSVDPKANLGHDEEILEALAFLPGDPDGRIDEKQAILFTPADGPLTSPP